MRTSTARLAAGLLPLALLAGACSDDDGGDAATEQSTDAADTTASDEMTADAGTDVVDTAVAAGDFGTLVTAVQAAGLEETLRGDGPYTVFAPTDEAFAALPAGTLDTLLADPGGDLSGILTYHVVEGEVLAERHEPISLPLCADPLTVSASSSRCPDARPRSSDRSTTKRLTSIG